MEIVAPTAESVTTRRPDRRADEAAGASGDRRFEPHHAVRRSLTLFKLPPTLCRQEMITPALPRLTRPMRVLQFVLFLVSATAIASLGTEETNTSGAPTVVATNDLLDSYVRLQEQLHATQLALERSRQESDTLAARRAEALASRLEQIESVLAIQRAREAESPPNGNRLLLAVASALGGMGLIALLLTAYLQWRTVNRLAGFSAALADSTRLTLPGPVGLPAANTSSARLLGAVDLLEKRILELEHPQQETRGAESHLAPVAVADGSVETMVEPEASSRIAVLLAKGQALLSLGQAAAARACFDEILADHPSHAETWVEKGLALEREQDPEAALACYDRAVALNGDFTAAYLHKATLCNQLGKHDQAIQCYEEVLRAQEKRSRHASAGTHGA